MTANNLPICSARGATRVRSCTLTRSVNFAVYHTNGFANASRVCLFAEQGRTISAYPTHDSALARNQKGAVKRFAR